MPRREISKSVEDIEREAEKMLEEARDKANTILLKAKEETKKNLSSPLPMDETETKSQEIIGKAKIEADKKGQDATNKASEIRTNADKKIAKVAERIVSIIIGAK